MNGARSIIGRIDVERIDADKRDAGIDERVRQFAGEMRMALEILIGAPVPVPTGVNQDRLAPERREIDRQPVDGTIAAIRCANDDAIEIGERFKFQLREIVTVGITMERAVEIGACVRDHLDLADLEFGAGGITCA